MVGDVHVPPNGKRARLSLGSYPATSLAKARGLAIEARGHVELGVTPEISGGDRPLGQ